MLNGLYGYSEYGGVKFQSSRYLCKNKFPKFKNCFHIYKSKNYRTGDSAGRLAETQFVTCETK